jgi:predicted AlkP superfamily phosphohydrolase/phosphomutase
MNPPRTLVIGLDGATFDLLDPLIHAGCLPTLRRIMAQGARSPLLSWPAMNSAASWSSIVTGVNPGIHGIYNFGLEWAALPRPGHRWRPITAADRKKEPFWRTLSAAGLQVGAVNVPISFPADPVNGFILAGMDAPSVNSQGFAYPPDLYAELRRQGIPYVIDTLNLSIPSQRDPFRLPDQVQDMLDARARAILYLMKNRPWDLLMAVFVATDRVQHCYWPDLDSPVDHPGWNPIRTLYQQIDAFLADALALAGEETTLLIVSDHGFTHSRRASHCLNPLFARLGLLGYKQAQSDWKGGLLRTLLRQGRRIVPYSLQYPLAKLLPGLHLQAAGASRFSSIDWARTQAYAFPPEGQVFLNPLDGALEAGVPPADYAALRERVTEIMLHLVDPLSGRSAVRQVALREDVYHGPYTASAPDLLVEWDYSNLGDGLAYNGKEGSITVDDPQRRKSSSGWKAVHHPQGVFIAYGPHIRPGLQISDAHIYDITPTILHLHRQPVTEDLDGRVLAEIFQADYIESNPVRMAPSSDTGSYPEKTVLSPEDERLIESRLKDLGYL